MSTITCEICGAARETSVRPCPPKTCGAAACERERHRRYNTAYQARRRAGDAAYRERCRAWNRATRAFPAAPSPRAGERRAAERERRAAERRARGLLTLPEAAARIGIATATIRHQVYVGAIFVLREGGHVYVADGEADRYAREQRGKFHSSPMYGTLAARRREGGS